MCLFITFPGNAQNKRLEKAHKSFNNFDYFQAIKQYMALVKKGTTSPKIYQNLGDANYLNAKYEEAAKWYGELAKMGSGAIDKGHMYRYAQSLRSLKKYELSNEVLAQLNALEQNDIRGVNYVQNKDYLQKIKERIGSYTIENLSINSSESDFAPSFSIEGLVFSSARDSNIISKNIHNWNKKRFLNLYTATKTDDDSFKNIMRFSEKLNTKLHESSTAFTKDGKTVYFTRNNGKKGKFKRDKEGVSRLQIYRATMKNGKWRNIKPLPFNADGYSVAHPTLNKTEDKLYFSSDMPGTLGHSDIFMVDIHADGTYGTPINLGDKINTESKESFPFVADDGVLYFASDGHPGLGGMDIFAVDINDLENSSIVNLGEPLNSTADDFSLIFNTVIKKGYFASNRADGKGDDDIYALEQLKPLDLECFKNITGTVKDKKTGAIIVEANILLYNDESEVIASTFSDIDGNFNLKSNCKKGDFLLVAEKDTYEKDMATYQNKSQETIAPLELLLLHIDTGAPIGTDLTKYLKIVPVYFDLDKSFIREDAKVILAKIIEYMNAYPDAKVQVGSHTDSRANDTYNEQLSQRRAQETVAYMAKQGIPLSRIKGIGFGETQLTNECGNTIKCTKEKHQQNRRSEFILVE